MTTIRYVLPWPPSVNHYWRVFRNRAILSSEGRQYRTRVCSMLAGAQPLLGHLRVKVDAYPPDNRRRDIENVLKALLDAMEHGGVYMDDNQVKDLHIVWRGKAPNGRVEVEIEPMEDRREGSVTKT